MRNPRKQAILDTELKRLAFYLTNRRSDEKKSDTRGTTGRPRVRVHDEW